MYNYAQLSVLARIRRIRVKPETLSFLFIAIMNSDQRFIHKQRFCVSASSVFSTRKLYFMRVSFVSFGVDMWRTNVACFLQV